MQKTIPIEKIVRGTNIREENDEEIMELVSSIKKQGLLNPITVQKKGEKYRVIAGHRRFLALQILQEPWVECNVLEYEPTEKDVLCIQLQENCCRKNMSAWEYVDLFNKLKKQGMTNQDLARMCGRSDSWITNQYQAAYTLEKNKAVTKKTKRMTATEIRKEFGGYERRKNSGRKSSVLRMYLNKASWTYSLTIKNPKARKDFEDLVKEFIAKWQS